MDLTGLGHFITTSVIIIAIGAGSATAADFRFPDKPPVAPLQQGAALPRPQCAELDNGMDVLVISNSEIPWVSVSWRLLVGENYGDAGKAGMANLTANMLTEGTENFTSDAFAEAVDSDAISISGGSGQETTYVSVGSLNHKVERAVELLAEAIRRPVFPAKDFNRVQRQTIQSMAVAEQDPMTQLSRAFNEWMYGEHYYGREASGTTRTLARITRDDLVHFHAEHYRPNYSTLIFSGDITKTQAVELANKYFGDWPRGTLPAVDKGQLAADEDMRIVIVNRDASKQTKILAGHLGFDRHHPDYVTMQVFNQVFGAGFVSRLNKRIRVDEGLTYGAGGTFSARREPGALVAFTFTRPEKIGDTTRVLIDEIKNMQMTPPTPEELEDSKSYLIGSFGLSMETPQDVANKIWDLKFYDLPYDYYDSYLEAVGQVTSEQVLEFSRNHVRPDKLKIVVVGREDEVRPQVEDIAPVTVVQPGEPIPKQPVIKPTM